MKNKISELPKNKIKLKIVSFLDKNALETVECIEPKKSFNKSNKSFILKYQNNLINRKMEKMSNCQSTNDTPKINDFNAIELSFVRKDYKGIEINKLNKNKIHISFCDMFKKPLADIIEVESYKKLNYLIYIGFAENEYGEECETKNEMNDSNNNDNTLFERRKKQSEIQAKEGKESICSFCNVF